MLCRPANMDGAGGRAMSPSEVNKLTLAQAIYYLRERSSVTNVSKQEATLLQRRQSEEDKKRIREKINQRIAWASGK
jgi:hypothetical protein